MNKSRQIAIHRVFALLGVGLAVPFAAGAETLVGPCDVGTNLVSAAVAETGLVSVGPGGTLYKTGVGTWTVSLGALGAWNAQAIAVKNGGLVLDMDDATPTAAPCPTDVIEGKALFWFDASTYATKPGNFETRQVGEKVYLDKMYDVRETDTANRMRPVATADHLLRSVKEGLADGVSGNCETKQDETRMPSPEIVTVDGRPAFFFGGVGSGRRMQIFRKGRSSIEYLYDVTHVFMVQKVVNGSGPAFAPSFRGVGCWEGTAARSLNAAMLHTDEGAKVLGHRLYVNGERKDGFVDKPATGVSLYECELTSVCGCVYGLFVNNDCQDGSACKIAPGDDGSRATVVQQGGGDYVYEMLCFTNRLTGAERQQVAEYLTRKWMTPKLGEPVVAGAVGTTVAVRSGATVTNVTARASAATIVKAGAGDLVFAHEIEDDRVPYGAVRLSDEGRVLAERPIALEMQAGKTVTASDDDHATVYVQSPLGADKADWFVKEGRSSVTVRTVPTAVKRIDVKKGKVVFHPQRPDSETHVLGVAGDRVFIPIRNASFEEKGSGYETAWGRQFPATGDYCGWVNLTEKTTGFFYDVDTWGLDEVGMNGSKRKDWGLTARPHDGSAAVAFQRKTGIRTADPIAFEKGWHEIEFWTNTRGSSVGGVLDVLLIDPETGDQTVICRAIQPYVAANGFGLRRFRFRLAESASRYLGFMMPDGEIVSNLTALDDVKVWRIADPADPTEWAVPGGDFDLVETDAGSSLTNKVFSPRHLWHPAWELTQPAGTSEAATGDALGVGIGDAYLTAPSYNAADQAVVFYNDTRYPYRSSQLVFLNNGAQASTTFTPPAGTWYLKGDLAENGAGVNGTVTATVTPQGETAVTLGSVDPNAKVMKTFRFTGKSFTADGKTPVTLTLSYAVSTGSTTAGSKKHVALYVDDLKLTKLTADGRDILRWGDIAWSSTGWTNVTTPTGGNVASVQYADYPNDGCDPIGGTGGFVMRYDGGRYYSHDFKRAGTYRFSCYLNRNAALQAISPVRFWVAQGAETNQLAVEKCGTVFQREYSSVFRIPRPGVYSFGMTALAPKGAEDEEGKDFYEVVIDNYGLSDAGDGELVDKDDLIGEDVRIDVAENAMIDLNFVGTNKIGRLKLGGRFVHGVVSSKTHPAYISGPGALELKRRGSVLIFK